MNKPQAGQWWIEIRSNTIYYVVGSDHRGYIMWQRDDGSILRDNEWVHYHHEPECTGFDWKPTVKEPVKIPVPLYVGINDFNYGHGHGIGFCKMIVTASPEYLPSSYRQLKWDNEIGFYIEK